MTPLKGKSETNQVYAIETANNIPLFRLLLIGRKPQETYQGGEDTRLRPLS